MLSGWEIVHSPPHFYSFSVLSKLSVLSIAFWSHRNQSTTWTVCMNCFTVTIARTIESIIKPPLAAISVESPYKLLNFNLYQAATTFGTNCIDLYHSEDSSCKAWPDTKTKHTTGKSKPKLVSGPIVRLIHQSIVRCHQLEFVVLIRFCMANELNGQGLPVHHS